MSEPDPTPTQRPTPYRVRSGARTPAQGAEASEPSADAVVTVREVRPNAPRLLNVGYGNLVAAARVIAIVAPTAAPMRRLRREAAERGKLVDATEGRRTRSILILDSDHVVLSAILPDTLAARLAGDEPERVA